MGAETFDFGNGRAVWMLSAVFKDRDWRDRKERETTTLGEKSRRKGILGEGSWGFDVPSQVVSRSWSGRRALSSFCLVCSRKESAMAILKGFGVAIISVVDEFCVRISRSDDGVAHT